MSEKGKNERFSPFLRQLWVSSGVTMSIVGAGCVVGFATILVSQLKQPDSPIPVTTEDASWIASIVGFALLVGNVIAPILMGRYGRRFTLLLTAVPITAGWVMILFAKSVLALILARFCQGLCLGMHAPLCAVMIGEYCSPGNRGMFLISNSLGLAAGVLIVHIMGTFLSWQYTALFSIFFTFLSVVIVIYSPETPSWLASKQRYDECRKVFLWLRGTEDEEQLEELEVMLASRQQEVKDGGREKISFKATLEKKEFYKPILIMFHLYILFQFSGMNILNAYTLDILDAILGKGQDPHKWMIILDIIRLVVTVIAAYILRIVKRRMLLYSSGLLTIISLLSIASYTYSIQTHLIPDHFKILPIFLIVLYMFSLSIGMVPVPFTIAGEIFPVIYRSLGGGISVLMLSAMFFASVKTAPACFESLGVHGAFVIYAGISLYCLIVLWFMLPETKDRTLQEIENEFRGMKYDVEDIKDFKSMQSLYSNMSVKEYMHEARRCSQPTMY